MPCAMNYFCQYSCSLSLESIKLKKQAKDFFLLSSLRFSGKTVFIFLSSKATHSIR